MRKNIRIILLALSVLCLALAGGCNSKKPLILTEENIVEWFGENREYFEAVKEQILLYETDMQNFRFYESWKNIKVEEGFSGKAKTLKKGSLNDALKAFFQATRHARFDRIYVTWNDDECKTTFYSEIRANYSTNNIKIFYDVYFDEKILGLYGYGKLADGWYYHMYVTFWDPK